MSGEEDQAAMEKRKNRRSHSSPDRTAELMGYPYDDPDRPVGYWEERWAEFVRLWNKRWYDDGMRWPISIVSAIFLGLCLYGLIQKLF